jgi:hypothetical protein
MTDRYRPPLSGMVSVAPWLMSTTLPLYRVSRFCRITG